MMSDPTLSGHKNRLTKGEEEDSCLPYPICPSFPGIWI